MARAQRQLDPAIDALIRERLEPGEIVQGWTESGSGEIMVRLIDKELHSVCQPIAKRFGRGAGCGRTLSFRLQNGCWVFAGAGGWIS
jgi:hypothetical protein